MFKEFKEKKIRLIESIFDKRSNKIARDIIEHVETGITSKELQITLKSMDIDDIDIGLIRRQHYLFEKILKLVARNFNIYIYSMPGAGKTYLAQEIAKSLKLEFYFSGAILEPYKLIGFKNAKGDYIETDFFKCFKNGGLFLFDEMDASNPEALITINSALANGFLDFPCGRILAHEKFRLIAAGNTNGIDIGTSYTARQQLDIATLDRFIFIEMKYDEKLEEKIARSYVNGKELFDKFLTIRRIVFDEKMPLICSTRSLILSLKLVASGHSWKEAFEMTVLKTALPKIKERIFNILETGILPKNSGVSIKTDERKQRTIQEKIKK